MRAAVEVFFSAAGSCGGAAAGVDVVMNLVPAGMAMADIARTLGAAPSTTGERVSMQLDGEKIGICGETEDEVDGGAAATSGTTSGEGVAPRKKQA